MSIAEARLAPVGSLDDLHWAHGDGLGARGLTKLPVITGRALPRTTPGASAEAGG